MLCRSSAHSAAPLAVLAALLLFASDQGSAWAQAGTAGPDPAAPAPQAPPPTEPERFAGLMGEPHFLLSLITLCRT